MAQVQVKCRISWHENSLCSTGPGACRRYQLSNRLRCRHRDGTNDEWQDTVAAYRSRFADACELRSTIMQWRVWRTRRYGSAVWPCRLYHHHHRRRHRRQFSTPSIRDSVSVWLWHAAKIAHCRCTWHTTVLITKIYRPICRVYSYNHREYATP